MADWHVPSGHTLYLEEGVICENGRHKPLASDAPRVARAQQSGPLESMLYRPGSVKPQSAIGTERALYGDVPDGEQDALLGRPDMGCDVHLAVEALQHGRWWFEGCTNVDRNYALFGEMAGVREEGSHVFSEPRGLPDDVATLTTLYLTEFAIADHSFSWLSARELLSVADPQKGIPGSMPLFHVVRGYCAAYGEQYIRVVFGFDS